MYYTENLFAKTNMDLAIIYSPSPLPQSSSNKKLIEKPYKNTWILRNISRAGNK